MHPILFTIPGIELPIYSYGVMLGLSLVVGWYIIMWLGKKDGLPAETMGNCFVWTAVAAILGSRVLYIVTNPREFADANIVDMINLRKGGLVAYGGFLGGFVGSWLYLRKHRIRLLAWADVVVPTLASGLGITRIGCFLYGCDYGRPIPADAPSWIQAIGVRFPNWKIRFPDLYEQIGRAGSCVTSSFRGAPAFEHHVDMGLVRSDMAWSAPVYPTQLMEVANGWIAFGLLMLVRSRTHFRGQTFLFFTAYYGLTRTLMELLRGDTQRGGVGEISTSQIIGITTLVLAVAAWIVLARRAKADPVAAMSLGPGASAEPAGKSSVGRKRKR